MPAKKAIESPMNFLVKSLQVWLLNICAREQVYSMFLP